jgi:hypothetical protein
MDEWGPAEIEEGIGGEGAGEQRGGRRFSTRVQRQERYRKRAQRAHAVRTILFVLIALVAGTALGTFVVAPLLPAGSVSSVTRLFTPVRGHASVGEADLDKTLGTYVCNGVRTEVTVREAIEQNTSVETARNSDGTYDIPSADTVLAIARNRLLLQEAESRGITATDADVVAYAKEVWQTEDVAVIAASYGMTEDKARAFLGESATIKKLRDVVAAQTPAQKTVPPTAPEAGKENEPMQTYADYILALMGDEWDAKGNTWAREDGPYHERMKNFTISNDGATYSAAQEAFAVAQTLEATANQQDSTAWTSFVNGILADASIEINTLVA